MKKIALKKGDIVEVDWVDSASIHGWADPDSTDDFSLSTMACKSVGYVFKNTADRLVINQAVDKATGNTLATSVIPAIAITNIRKIGVSK